MRRIGQYCAATLLIGTALAKADTASEWNAIMVTTVGAQNPFAQARFAAIVHVAMFEAVNSIVGDYKPYLG